MHHPHVAEDQPTAMSLYVIGSGIWVDEATELGDAIHHGQVP